MDTRNKEKQMHDLRILLVGRPQIGKTNIFLLGMGDLKWRHDLLVKPFVFKLSINQVQKAKISAYTNTPKHTLKHSDTQKNTLRHKCVVMTSF